MLRLSSGASLSGAPAMRLAPFVIVVIISAILRRRPWCRGSADAVGGIARAYIDTAVCKAIRVNAVHLDPSGVRTGGSWHIPGDPWVGKGPEELCYRDRIVTEVLAFTAGRIRSLLMDALVHQISNVPEGDPVGEQAWVITGRLGMPSMCERTKVEEGHADSALGYILSL